LLGLSLQQASKQASPVLILLLHHCSVNSVAHQSAAVLCLQVYCRQHDPVFPANDKDIPSSPEIFADQQ
jgi:hypothetical protein